MSSIEARLTLKQCAALSGWSEHTLRREIHNGALIADRIGQNPRGHIRVRESELHRWLDFHRSSHVAS